MKTTRLTPQADSFSWCKQWSESSQQQQTSRRQHSTSMKTHVGTCKMATADWSGGICRPASQTALPPWPPSARRWSTQRVICHGNAELPCGVWPGARKQSMRVGDTLKSCRPGEASTHASNHSVDTTVFLYSTTALLIKRAIWCLPHRTKGNPLAFSYNSKLWRVEDEGGLRQHN